MLALRLSVLPDAACVKMYKFQNNDFIIFC